MAGADKFQLELADRLGGALDRLQKASIAAQVGRSDPSSIEDATPDATATAEQKAEFNEAFVDVQEIAREIPTNDDGDGTGPIHRGVLTRLAEHGFHLPAGSSGTYAPVEIQVDDNGSTLKLNLGSPQQT